jgi:1-deoxy-D-xylulose-5-phosphate reductoisomerase
VTRRREVHSVISDNTSVNRPASTSPSPRRVVILGSTGSIGTQALDVIGRNREQFSVAALCAGGRDLDLLVRQAVEFGVQVVGVSQAERAEELRQRLGGAWTTALRLGPPPQILAGPTAAQQCAELDCDVVLNGVAGSQGLRATLAGLHAGRTIALANKESLIAGGPLVLQAAAPGQLVAVDSEHSALAQALRAGAKSEVRRLVLTASGGPFRGRRREQLTDVTPAQALAHPTWIMGPLVTTNSATLVNKGLEVIEAALLFDVDYDRIEVVVHPQSMVHSMVEFVDGSTIAQASPPDMRMPISLALGWPDRIADAAPGLDFQTAHTWTFEPVDNEAFPAIEVAKVAGRAGGCAPAVFNAANEALVAAFHAGRCGFADIVDVTRATLELWLSQEHQAAGNPRDVSDVEQAESWAVRHAQQRLQMAD